MNWQEKQTFFRLLWTQERLSDLTVMYRKLNIFTYKRTINKSTTPSLNSLQTGENINNVGWKKPPKKPQITQTDGSIWWWWLPEIIYKRRAVVVCAEDVKCLCLQLKSKSTEGEHWPRAVMSQQGRGVLVTSSRGAATLLPLLICTIAPPMGRQTLLLLVQLYCERPGAIWHHSAVRWAVIQPGLADCQWRGLLLLMQMGEFPLPLSQAEPQVNLLWTCLSYFYLFFFLDQCVNNYKTGCRLNSLSLLKVKVRILEFETSASMSSTTLTASPFVSLSAW